MCAGVLYPSILYIILPLYISLAGHLPPVIFEALDWRVEGGEQDQLALQYLALVSSEGFMGY